MEDMYYGKSYACVAKKILHQNKFIFESHCFLYFVLPHSADEPNHRAKVPDQLHSMLAPSGLPLQS